MPPDKRNNVFSVDRAGLDYQNQAGKAFELFLPDVVSRAWMTTHHEIIASVP